jgi:hypothetical protein
MKPRLRVQAGVQLQQLDADAHRLRLDRQQQAGLRAHHVVQDSLCRFALEAGKMLETLQIFLI